MPKPHIKLKKRPCLRTHPHKTTGAPLGAPQFVNVETKNQLAKKLPRPAGIIMLNE